MARGDSDRLQPPNLRVSLPRSFHDSNELGPVQDPLGIWITVQLCSTTESEVFARGRDRETKVARLRRARHITNIRGIFARNKVAVDPLSLVPVSRACNIHS